MSVTVLDGVVVVVVLVSAMLAMVRGFVREVLSVASWVIAALAAYYFYKPVLPYLQPYIASEHIATVVSAAGIFFVTLIIVSIIATKIADVVVDSRIGLLDRTLGFVFGAARGVLLVVIAFALLSWILSDKQPAWVTNAQTAPILKKLGDSLVAAMPADIGKNFRSHLQELQDKDGGPASEDGTPTPPAEIPGAPGATAPNQPAGSPAAPALQGNGQTPGQTPGQAPGYDGQERQGLDKLIDGGNAPNSTAAPSANGVQKP